MGSARLGDCVIFGVLGAVFGAGSILLRSKNHIAMLYGHFAGVCEAAILCGDGDGGDACAYGGHFAVCVHRGNGFIIAAPSYVFVGGIGWLHRGGELGGAIFSQSQCALIQRNASSRNRGGFVDRNAQFLAVAAVTVFGFHGKGACVRCGGRAEKHSIF